MQSCAGVCGNIQMPKLCGHPLHPTPPQKKVIKHDYVNLWSEIVNSLALRIDLVRNQVYFCCDSAVTTSSATSSAGFSGVVTQPVRPPSVPSGPQRGFTPVSSRYVSLYLFLWIRSSVAPVLLLLLFCDRCFHLNVLYTICSISIVILDYILYLLPKPNVIQINFN